MATKDKYPRTLHSLAKFLNDALHLKPFSDTLEGFHYNRELLKAASMNTYLETVGNRADSIHSAIYKSTLKDIAEAYIDTVSVITRHVALSSKKVMLAFDYTGEDFYGELNNTWIHGWTGEHGVTGKFKFLSCNVVNDELMMPIFSIPAQMGVSTAHDIEYIDKKVQKHNIFGNVDLSLFDRGFYSKEVMYKLDRRNIPYLILVPKTELVKKEFESMKEGGTKGLDRLYSFHKNDDKYEFKSRLNFIKGIFNRKTDSYLDWCFATNFEEETLGGFIRTYKKRWRIETGFRVQDEAKIKTKSVDIKVRYLLFVYAQLLQAHWALIFKEDDVSFKKYLIELSRECDRLVEKSERRRSA
jgi:hypothetical protein